MIIYKQGDLTQAIADVIFHGCNCFCVMGAGVAKALAIKWPEVKEADLTTTPGDKKKLGSFTIAYIGSGQVLNMYTQYTYGGYKPIDYEAVRSCMEMLRDYLDTCDPNHNLIIAGPRIGAGLAGGDWTKIEKIINSTFPNREIQIYTL